MNAPALPDFQSPQFLESHVQSILNFYEPVVLDPAGGFFQCFKDSGEVYDTATRHLVSSTRFVFNYAEAYRRYGKAQHLDWARHGLDFLIQRHRQSDGHYAWVLHGTEVSDNTAMAYGHAFVILAAASCVRIGIDAAKPLIDDTYALLEALFWEPKHRAYADERDGSLATLDAYRGQNANMHLCEALLAAHVATGQRHFLDRAETLAERFAIELAEQSGGLIWEHYHSDWTVDMHYNIDHPDDLFKPWGFQPGHQVEWAKLLLQLDALRPDGRWLPRAVELYDAALTKGWDEAFGGLVYGFAPDGSFCDAHKYFWVQAEAFAAAWRLYRRTGESRYASDYQRLWQWSWQHLIDHEQGAWFRIRHRDGSHYDDLKSPPGKTDYHTMGACWDVLSVG